MRIQHNIAALNSFRNLTNNNSAVSKNLEKLSSGYRINRAGDDAAGLAISEKMRAQITGLETAQKNANDGISLVQTAEGALTEVHSMLNRMVELADQSANGTYQNEVDRENLQSEMQSLKSEIDRISKATNFNGINLLDGSLSGAASVLGDINFSDTKTVTGSFTTANFTDGAGALAEGDEVSYTVAWTDGDGNEFSKTIKLTVGEDAKALVAEDGTEYSLADGDGNGATKTEIQDAILAELKKDKNLTNSFDITKSTDALKFESTVPGSKGATIDAIAMTSSNTTTIPEADGLASSVTGKDSYQKLELDKVSVIDSSSEAEDIANAIFEINGKKFILGDGSNLTDEKIKELGIDADVTVIKLAGGTYTAGTDAKNVAAAISRETGLEFEVADTNDADAGINANDIIYKGADKLTKGGNSGLTLQIGDTSDDFNQLSVSVGAMDTKSLGVDGVDISSQDGAKAAVQTLKDAINKVSSTRGDLGAIQNRLEHTINNLSVTSENMTAAESRIRDVDMAKEMMSYTKNNILVQSSQAMLAQANQIPQGVLQLLQ